MGFPFPPTHVQAAMEMSWFFLSILDFPILSLIHTNKFWSAVNTIPIPSGFFDSDFPDLTHWCTKKNLQENRQPKNLPTPVFILTNFGIPVNCAHFIVVFILTNHGLLSTMPIPSCHLLPPKYTLNKPKEPLTNACLYIII